MYLWTINTKIEFSYRSTTYGLSCGNWLIAVSARVRVVRNIVRTSGRQPFSKRKLDSKSIRKTWHVRYYQQYQLGYGALSLQTRTIVITWTALFNISSSRSWPWGQRWEFRVNHNHRHYTNMKTNLVKVYDHKYPDCLNRFI